MPVGLSLGAALRTNVQIGCNIVHIPYLVNYSVIEKHRRIRRPIFLTTRSPSQIIGGLRYCVFKYLRTPSLNMLLPKRH
jgi:hypothetical protein